MRNHVLLGPLIHRPYLRAKIPSPRNSHIANPRLEEMRNCMYFRGRHDLIIIVSLLLLLCSNRVPRLTCVSDTTIHSDAKTTHKVEGGIPCEYKE
jgi:hypothetical protein